jgi:hypothetical protein
MLFHQTAAGPLHLQTGWVSSVFRPTATRQTWNSPSVYFATSLVGGVGGGPAICPLTVLDYVIPSRADDWLWSPCRVADLLGSNKVSSRMLAVRCLRFCVCILWKVQGVPDACRTCSVILCVLLLLFQDRRKEAKKKRKENSFWLGGPRITLAIMCYKELI